jgi:hypothetical protein
LHLDNYFNVDSEKNLSHSITANKKEEEQPLTIDAWPIDGLNGLD